MVSFVEIKGFDEFDKYTKSIDDNESPVLFYFSGAKLPDGNSWCPDCVEGIYSNLFFMYNYLPKTYYYIALYNSEKRSSRYLYNLYMS